MVSKKIKDMVLGSGLEVGTDRVLGNQEPGNTPGFVRAKCAFFGEY